MHGPMNVKFFWMFYEDESQWRKIFEVFVTVFTVSAVKCRQKIWCVVQSQCSAVAV
jgi:hypothetical protein